MARLKRHTADMPGGQARAVRFRTDIPRQGRESRDGEPAIGSASRLEMERMSWRSRPDRTLREAVDEIVALAEAAERRAAAELAWAKQALDRVHHLRRPMPLEDRQHGRGAGPRPEI